MGKTHFIKSTAVVGSFTALSRVLGLVRDVIMGSLFGTSLYMSAFVVAFTIPNLFRKLFGEGALSATFIPVFIESRHRDGDASAWTMAREVATMLLTALLILTAAGMLLLTAAMHWLDLGERAAMIMPLLRVMLPYAIFICLAALSMAILNSYHHYAVPAATPCLLNLVLILAAAFICPRYAHSPEKQVWIFSWAVIAAGILQLAVQLPVLMKFGYRPGLSFRWNDPRVARMLTLMGPAALGLAVTQFNVLIDRMLATWIGDWAPAALFFSERLIYLPLGIFAVAMSTVLLPTFSGHMVQTDTERLKRTLNRALRNLLFVMIPAAVGLLVLARPIVEMIFQWKNFTARSTDLTVIALQFYAPGLVVFSLAKVFVPAFYARQDTRTPVRIGLYTVLLNLILNITFVLTWPLYLKHGGLALATVLAEAFYAIALAFILHRRIGSPGWREIASSVALSAVCTVMMALTVILVYSLLVIHPLLLPPGSRILLMMNVLVSIAAGMGVYFAAAAGLKSTELAYIIQVLRRRAQTSSENT
ncbi:MAG: murein biosynthesis integral membrane protein MurJ [Kiritimatiellia bacterium]